MYHRRQILALCVLAALFFAAATPASALFGKKEEPAVAAGAPIPQNQDVETYQDIPYQGTLSAVDNEGDSYTFSVAEEPGKGTVEIGEDGVTFLYTPEAGKSGKDSFTVTATDTEGNTSAPATITVTIHQQKTAVSYSDMDGNPAHAAAICLAEAGIFVGEQIADAYFFDPEAPVSRSEFLAMAMDAAGIQVSDQVRLTGFQDDDAIATWAKGYATAAVREGLISGVSTGSGVCFNGEDTITLREAATVMDRLLDVADVQLDSLDVAEQTWATQALANMASVQVVSAASLDAQTTAAPVTRAQAATMLSAAIRLMESQEEGGGLFGWLK